MGHNDPTDYTSVFIKIFTLTNNLRSLRKAFDFSQSDERAARDREFIKKWKEIESGSEKD